MEIELADKATKALHPLKRWRHSCHAASLALLRSGFKGRIARGGCVGVGGQHSWLILSDDCYDSTATIIDPTLWSYDKSVKGVWIGTYDDNRHMPFGAGNIWAYGRPLRPTEPIYRVKSKRKLSRLAKSFIDLLGPMDFEGWCFLARCPMEGWPSKEIITMMTDDPKLRARIPIDIIGMVTDTHPLGYLK